MSVTGSCNYCRTKDARHEVRKRYLCTDCFQDYVGTKISKQMVSYSFKNLAEEQNRRLLLPLSGGPCSLSLLYSLNDQLKRQIAKRNRTAYDVVLAHVQIPDTTSSEQLHDIFDLDDRVEADLKEIGIARVQGEANADLITRIFGASKTATARADLLEILLQRCLVGIARREGCEGIVWGHSDSRLAAQTLADVAKGRGGAVPNGIADGPSPYGVDFKYPMRELFRSELESYLQTIVSAKDDYLLPTGNEKGATVATRTTSIDDLLTGYISSQGEKYPGIMANVVRTASKLQLPSDVKRRCSLCFMPITTKPETTMLCYGCERMKKDFKS